MIAHWRTYFKTTVEAHISLDDTRAQTPFLGAKCHAFCVKDSMRMSRMWFSCLYWYMSEPFHVWAQVTVFEQKASLGGLWALDGRVGEDLLGRYDVHFNGIHLAL